MFPLMASATPKGTFSWQEARMLSRCRSIRPANCWRAWSRRQRRGRLRSGGTGAPPPRRCSARAAPGAPRGGTPWPGADLSHGRRRRGCPRGRPTCPPAAAPRAVTPRGLGVPNLVTILWAAVILALLSITDMRTVSMSVGLSSRKSPGTRRAGSPGSAAGHEGATRAGSKRPRSCCAT